MNTPSSPSTSIPTEPSLTLDPVVQSHFYQPPTGGVEVFLSPVFSPEVLRVESAYSGLQSYEIDTAGTGPETVEQVIRTAVFESKLHSEATFSRKVWDGWLMLTLGARFYSTLSQRETPDLRPSGVSDIHPALEEGLGAEAIERIEKYQRLLREGHDLGVHGQFWGYSEDGRRPLFFIDRSGSSERHVVITPPTPVARDSVAFGWGILNS